MRNCKFNPKIKEQDNSPIIESNKKDTKQPEHISIPPQINVIQPKKINNSKK